jgi:hypothetical protein
MRGEHLAQGGFSLTRRFDARGRVKENLQPAAPVADLDAGGSRANANAAVQVDSGANDGQKSGRSEM